ncbi:MAG: hypothetical protein RL391_825 [Actinomycetota bacterium]|jgi:hypothetical protein
MRRFRPRSGAGGRVGNRGQSESLEVMLHVLTSLLPDGKENALALVIA